MTTEKASRGLTLDVEVEALDDERFSVCAEIAGFDVDAIWGKFLRLWAWCLKRQEFELPEAVIRRFLGPNGVRAILADGIVDFSLGEQMPNGMIRVRGAEERLSWLAAKRENASAGGKARAARAQRGTDGSFVSAPTNVQPAAGASTSGSTSAVPAQHQPSTSGIQPLPLHRPLPRHAPDPDQGDREDPGPSDDPARSPRVRAGARDPTVPTATPTPASGTGPSPETRERIKYVDDVFARVNAARKRIDPSARELPLHDQGRLELARMLVERGNSIRSDIEHVVAVRIAEAETPPCSVRWLSGRMFSGTQWQNAIAMTVADARRQRAGPRARDDRSIREILDEALPDQPTSEPR